MRGRIVTSIYGSFGAALGSEFDGRGPSSRARGSETDWRKKMGINSDEIPGYFRTSTWVLSTDSVTKKPCGPTFFSLSIFNQSQRLNGS
jgi:hypothetical protein